MKIFDIIHAPLKSMKKRNVIVVAVAAVLLFATGVTLAYIFTETKPVENVFAPSKVSCVVEETFENNVKSDVKIKNDGDTEAYVRVFVNITWMSLHDGQVTMNKPAEGQDYSITFQQGTNWQKGADGYWYYKLPVAPNEATEILIKECKLNEGANAPEGFNLSVEIVSSAIQSLPTTVVAEQWSTGVESVNGTMLVIKPAN